MIEVAAVAVLIFIAWTLDRIAARLKAIEVELSIARWERGKRLSDMKRASKRGAIIGLETRVDGLTLNCERSRGFTRGR